MKKIIFIFYSIFLSLFTIFSYAFIDPNFIYLHNLYSGFALTNRNITTALYIMFILVFFVFYILFIKGYQEKILKNNDINLLIAITAFVLFFSYPTMLSYDIFNYNATAKVMFHYHENPYIIMPIEFINDPLLLFTHAANKIALYGPFWIFLSSIPYILGFGNFLITLFLFKFFNILFYFGTLYIIWKISRNYFSVAVFGLNPLVIIETIASGHNDIAMMFFAIFSLFLLMKKRIAVGLLVLVLSILVKYATLFLIPVYLYSILGIIRKKKINNQLIFFISAISMLAVFLLSPLREEMYPWYAIWFFVFTALIPERKFILYLSIAFTYGLLLRYVPFMLLGIHFGPTPVIKIILTFLPPLFFLFFVRPKKNFMVKKYIGFSVVVIFAFIAGISLLHSGFIPTHDGEYHVIRFYEFHKVLLDGNWYPRWAPDLNYGFGVPLFNYVYPLPNYFASVLHLFGISFIDAFKLNMLTALILGSIFFYLWAREFWGNLGGLVSSIFYSFSPYFFVDIYIRGSVGEVWALGLFPLFLWAATKAIFKNLKLFIPFSGLSLALVIFSHNILAFAFFPFAISYMLLLVFLSKNRIIKIRNSLIIIFLGLGLSSIFWIPAIFERNFVTGLQIFDLKNNFADFYQLLIPSWGSGFFGTGAGNEMSIQIGVANLISVIVSFFTGFLLLKKKDKRNKLILFFLIWFFLLVLLMMKISAPIWDFFPLMNYFQFPWRFLSIVILTTAFLAGSIFSVCKSKLLAGIMILTVFLLGIGYARSAHYFYRDDNYYLSKPNFMDGTNSPGNVFNTIWIKGKLSKQNKKIIINNKEGKISIKKISSTIYIFESFLRNNSNIIINTAYFPGWYAIIDNKSSVVSPTEDGLIKVYIPKGKHTIEVKFGNTFIRQISEVIFLITFLVFLALIIKNLYMKKYEYWD